MGGTMSEFNSEIEFEYDGRFVVFLDILGCKNLINNSTCDNFSFEKVKLIAQLFYETQKQYIKPHWDSAFKFPMSHQGMTYDTYLSEENIVVEMSLFSDSIIISYMPYKEDRFIIWYRQMHQILNDICRLQFKFALNGIFLRGGMSYGKVFHNKNICFGPALIKAVELENKAVNPCIAVDNLIVDKIFQDMKSSEKDDYCPGFKYAHEIKDFAEDLYLTYFNRMDVFGKNIDSKIIMINWLVAMFYNDSRNIAKIKPIIEAELQKNYILEIAKKYEWLKKYYNYAIYFEEGHSNMKII